MGVSLEKRGVVGKCKGEGECGAGISSGRREIADQNSSKLTDPERSVSNILWEIRKQSDFFLKSTNHYRGLIQHT